MASCYWQRLQQPSPKTRTPAIARLIETQQSQAGCSRQCSCEGACSRSMLASGTLPFRSRAVFCPATSRSDRTKPAGTWPPRRSSRARGVGVLHCAACCFREITPSEHISTALPVRQDISASAKRPVRDHSRHPVQPGQIRPRVETPRLVSLLLPVAPQVMFPTASQIRWQTSRQFEILARSC